MTQIEQIKVEIERLINLFPKSHGEVLPIDQNAYNLLGDLKLFIESLPAEQPSEKLEYLATSLEETIGTSPHSREVILDHLKQAANWQKEQILKNSEHVDVWKSSSGYIYDMTRLRDLINKVCQGEDSAKIIVVKEDKPPINKLDNKESYIEFPPVKKSSEECYSCNIIINN